MVLSNEELDAALQKVSYMFPSAVVAHEDIVANPGGPRLLARNGRCRVDSQARPTEFLRSIKFSDRSDAIQLQEFSVRGVQGPMLRQRLESKAIDLLTLNRVMSEFEVRDKLSVQDLSKLRELSEQAQQQHRSNDDSGAEKLFEQVLLSDPVNFDCLIGLAKMKYAKSDLEAARDLFDRALIVRPEREKTMYQLGRVLFDLKSFDRAKVLFEQVVQGFNGEIMGDKCDQHTYHNAIAMLGLIHQKVLQDFDKADKLYQIVLGENDKHILALDHTCALLVQSNKGDEGAVLHRKVCTLDPNHTRKSCPYLDSLFPTDSQAMHGFRPIQRRIEDWSTRFGSGLPKKHWSNHPFHSLVKKLRRALGAS